MADRYVGIDVSKTTLEVAVLPEERRFRVANDPTGWTELVTQVAPAGATCVVLEATNTYHRGVLLALTAAGMPAAVVNPERTHAFARSEGIRAKTDRHDARLLARFAQQKQPAPSEIRSAPVRRLQDYLACRADLTQLVVQEKNRLDSATDPLVVALHEETITELEQKLVRLDEAITDVIASDANLAERRRLLRTTPGVGPVISAVVVAGLPELGELDKRAIASLAGLAPHPRDSGTTQGQRSCVGGRRAIAQALYQMAVSATRWEPTVRAHYEQLCRRRPPKVALVACARRMLGMLTVMVRDGLTWQETKVGQGQFLPNPA